MQQQQQRRECKFLAIFFVPCKDFFRTNQLNDSFLNSFFQDEKKCAHRTRRETEEKLILEGSTIPISMYDGTTPQPYEITTIEASEI